VNPKRLLIRGSCSSEQKIEVRGYSQGAGKVGIRKDKVTKEGSGEGEYLERGEDFNHDEGN